MRACSSHQLPGVLMGEVLLPIDFGRVLQQADLVDAGLRVPVRSSERSLHLRLSAAYAVALSISWMLRNGHG